MPFMKVCVRGPYVGTEHIDYVELPDDWDEFLEGQQEDFEVEVWEEAVLNYIDGYTEVVENEGD